MFLSFYLLTREPAVWAGPLCDVSLWRRFFVRDVVPGSGATSGTRDALLGGRGTRRTRDDDVTMT